MTADELQNIMNEHPNAPDYIKSFNALAISLMRIYEEQQQQANIVEANRIIEQR